MNPLEELIGESAEIERVRDVIRRLLAHQQPGRRSPPVLLEGEPGTGKGLLARLLHRLGPRARGPFVDVNCAAIPDTLLESEMFGYERGAFTDARRAKPGLFELAHHGVIFLDEIGLLPEGLQAKLLTVVEERAVRRLGGTAPEPADVWIISATNADLQAAVRDRRFREDLYHRLAVLTLRLPPLRERGRDILVLAEHFLRRITADYGLPPRTFAPDARKLLMTYHWPGNVRELSNVIERAALLTDQSTLTPEVFDLRLPSPEAPTIQGRTTALLLEEREALLGALNATRWNLSRTASRLGISRNTVRRRIDRHGLHPLAYPAPSERRQSALAPDLPPEHLEELHLVVDLVPDLQADSPRVLAELSDRLHFVPIARLLPDLVAALRSFERVADLTGQYLALNSPTRKRQSLTEALAQSVALQRRLVATGRPAALSLLKVARRWHRLLVSARRALGAPGPGRPEIKNPFVFGDPVALTPNNLFTGRQDLVREIEGSILGTLQPPTLLLHGPRRTGKTSVLNQLPRLLGPDCAPAFLDCQNPAITESLPSLLRDMSRAISEALRRRHISLKPVGSKDLKDEPFAAFLSWLDIVEQKIPERMRVLLCLDEYERLQRAIDVGWGSRMLDGLRHLTQHRRGIALLFSGVQTLDQLGDVWTD